LNFKVFAKDGAVNIVNSGGFGNDTTIKDSYKNSATDGAVRVSVRILDNGAAERTRRCSPPFIKNYY
jgi:hypothetical protein